MTKKTKNLLLSGVILGIFCLFLIGVMVWEKGRNEMPLPTESQQALTAGTTETVQTLPSTTVPPETTLPQMEPRRLNFLLIGRDWHSEGENGRSDAMILCTVDTGTKQVTLTSFLRDIYLKIPGHGSSRLNASYSWGGSALLNETLAENFGITVDVNLEIDFDGFETMIDCLGGVDITLTEREAKYLNNGYGWTLEEGTNRLDGPQALAYSRIRYLDSDFVRTERQRNVLIALMGKYQTASMQELLRVTDIFLDHSTSDHTDEELLSYALEFHTMLDSCTIQTHRVPADGTYSYENIRGMSVIEVDLEENRELLESILNDT